MKVDIYDVVGKIIAAPQTMAVDAVSIGLEKLSSGIYFVRIQYENGQEFVHRFVKADRSLRCKINGQSVMELSN